MIQVNSDLIKINTRDGSAAANSSTVVIVLLKQDVIMDSFTVQSNYLDIEHQSMIMD